MTAATIEAKVEYEGPGERRKFWFKDLRDSIRVVISEAEGRRIPSNFIKEIVSKMPKLTKLGNERMVDRYGSYIERTDINDDTVYAMLKEIISMDEQMSKRIQRNMTECFSVFGTLVKAKLVSSCKNEEGKWVVKLTYETQFKPDNFEFNSYDEETGERSTWSKGIDSEQDALFLSQFFAGAINVRHVHDAS